MNRKSPIPCFDSAGYRFFKNILFLLFLVAIQPTAFSQSTIDTNFTGVTPVYLDASGKTTIELDTTSYNILNDSVYISQILFGCPDIGDSVNIYLTITDTSLVPAQTYFSDSTLIVALDTVAPVISMIPSVNLNLGASGNDSLMFDLIDNGSWDSCGLDIDAITYFPLKSLYLYGCG